MSESIWKEEVDTALLPFIQSITDVPAVMRKPEEEFKQEQYPLVSIYSLYDKFSKIRYNPNKQVVSKENGIAVLEQSCKPFELYYQIDFWANYQSDMNDMVMKWLAECTPDFVLPVHDKSGALRHCYVLAVESVKTNDLLKGTDRIFHSFATYRISVSIDENVQEGVPIVTEVEATVNSKPV